MTESRCFIRREQFGFYCPKCTARWDSDDKPECVRRDRQDVPMCKREPFVSGLPFVDIRQY